MTVAKSILSTEPTSIVRQKVTIGHIQLRDLMICPEERGVVNYVHERSIMERDVTDPSSAEEPLVTLNFLPNTIASLNLPDSNERLLAAGGQDAELHLSIYSRRGGTPREDTSDGGPRARPQRLWQFDSVLAGSINNSVLLTSLSLTRSHESSAEPRVAVSNNDCTIKFYDVNVRGSKGVDGPVKRISEAGVLRLEVPVNHSSISPDGRTLVSVGDSAHVYLHTLTGGARVTFTPLDKLTLPPFDPYGSSAYFSAVPASFSTAFSACGTKFAVASQEGMVAVWDVRSTKPLKVFQTDRSRAPAGHWYDDAWDWTRPGNTAPGWGVRNVKFSPAGHNGREVMTFTEHTSLLHVVDASTFETEEIVRVPSIVSDRVSPPPPAVPTGYYTRGSSPTGSGSSSETWTAPTPRPPSLPSPQPRVLLNGTEYPGPPSSARRTAGGSSTRTAFLWHTRAHASTSGSDDENAPLVVQVPALGDRDAERDVRRVLGRHGVRSTGPDGDRDGEDAGMDVDELEREHEEREFEYEHELDCVIVSRAGSPTPAPWRRQAAPRPREQAAVGGPWQLAVPPHLDLAGTCFDPRGEFVYVASTGGIVEWSVRGAEKKWWHESAWA